MAQKRARYDYTLLDKVWLLDYDVQNPGLNSYDLGNALADHVNSLRGPELPRVVPPGKSTVNDWRKPEKARQIREFSEQAKGNNTSAKRQRKAQFPELEQALALWFHQREARNLPITDDLVRGQAQIFGEQLDVPEKFTFSSGWLCNFKKRHCIKQIFNHSGADDESKGVQLSREAIQLIVKDGGYTEDNIYNQDEIRVFWRQSPQRTLATADQADKHQDKQRFTVSVCCNATGTDTCNLFIIGKTARPCSFPKNFQPDRDWRLRYRSNGMACMLTAEFSCWVKEWNSNLAVYVPMSTLYAVLSACVALCVTVHEPFANACTWVHCQARHRQKASNAEKGARSC